MKKLFVLLLMVGAIGCGYSAKGSGTMASAPTVTQLMPPTTMAGGLAFTLTVNGTNFADGAVVYWNGGTRTTKFVSGTQVTAAISAAVPSTYFGVRALSAMSAPASASTWAIPLPMPRPAPVMKTTFPVTSNSTGIMTWSPVSWPCGALRRLSTA